MQLLNFKNLHPFLNSVFLLIIITMPICSCQVYNTNSMDSVKYGAMSFSSVLQSKCTPCHNYYALTASELIAEGLVVAGNPSESLLFSSIIGSNVGGNETMPPASASAGQLTDDEIQLLETWINSL